MYGSGQGDDFFKPFFCIFNKGNETQCTGLSLKLKKMQIVAHSHNKIDVALRKIQMTVCVMLRMISQN